MGKNDLAFNWGTDTLDGVGGRDRPAPRRSPAKTGERRPSLLGTRAAALFIDGLVLLVPVFGAAFLLSLLFPDRGFFLGELGASTTARVSHGLPGALVIAALSLGYFFIGEAVYGRTIGKRAMGLRVLNADGQPAGLNAISTRTVLRIIDGLGVYLLGFLVALFTKRRRRIGDLLGNTIVVRDDDTLPLPPPRARWLVGAYPAAWTSAVLLAVFALGLGNAVGADQRAIALVHAYIKAREDGNASLACSMLTTAQQRNLVAALSGDYNAARADLCPSYILRNDSHTNLENPELPAVATAPLIAHYSPLGLVEVRSPQYPTIRIDAIVTGEQVQLDNGAFQRAGFTKGCTAAGRLTVAQCQCTYDWMRAQGVFDQASTQDQLIQTARIDTPRCLANPTATPA